MSKKLIAVAAAAALALTGLVATTSASALPVVKDEAAGQSYLSVTAAANRGGSGTSADPFTFPVPNAGTVATTSEALTFTVSSTLKSRPVTVTTTAGIKVLDELGNSTNKYIASSGKDSLTLTTTSSGTLTFVAFPTTTSTGTVTVSITDASTPPVVDTTQVYIKGTAGAAYAIKSVTAPTSVAPEGKGTFVAVLVDAFGNPAIAAGDTLSVTVVGGGTSSFASEATNADGKTGTNAKVSYSATSKRTAGVLTAGKVAGQIAVAMSLDTAAATDAQIAAFGTPVASYFTVITTAALSGQITTLTAQVATLTASVTALTADYNKLAARWNKKVANKTTLKKKVALK
jgi:hypothetical protein